ncbi:MAG: hypothetical protein WCS53_03325 [Bacilli bacterium]|jgi:hypothetical protein
MTKKEILKMLEDGVINVDEAMEMMEHAVEEPMKDAPKAAPKTEVEVLDPIKKAKKKYKYLIIKVRSGENGSERVNVTLPVGLLKYAKKFSANVVKDAEGRDALNQIDFDEIMAMLEEGSENSKIIDIADGNETVEIYFE